MNFKISTLPLQNLKSQAVVLLAAQDKITDAEKHLDKLLDKQISGMRNRQDFTGEAGKNRIMFGAKNFDRVLLVGLGKATDLNLEKVREAIALALGALKSLPIKSVSIILPKVPKASVEQTAQAMSEAVAMANYDFSYYKSQTPAKTIIDDFEIILDSAKDKRAAAKGLTAGLAIARAVSASRDLGNHPANVATPEHLAKHARALGKEFPKDVKVKVLGKPEIIKENMGALLGVSQGSDEEPRFIILEYLPKKTGPLIVLVGKGLTFDSGGISIKPSDKMDEMKYDMAGGADVMGVIQAAAELKLPINLVGLIPATENLPSGKAIKPGDILKSRSGKTIEVVNTDAEGRLILSDALDYAKKYQPDLVIDYATLTGSIVVALGDDLIGAFTNAPRLLPQLEEAAKTTGEKIWPMPLVSDYMLFIKSDFADLRNQSTMRYGDAIHAANFLREFTDYPWIHMDIAGVAWATREKPYRPKGATGTGIRLTLEFLKNFKKK